MTSQDDATMLAKLVQQMVTMSTDLADIKRQIASLNTSLERLARIEERHEAQRRALERAFESLKEHDSRIKTIEVQEPISKMVNRWVIAGVIGIVGFAGLQVWGTIVQANKTPATIIIDTEMGRVKKGESAR